MKFEVMLITPEIAAEMLTKNTVNRRLDRGLVLQLAGYMQTGHYYEDTAEPIKFSNGYLIDGQHRLAAIVKSGIAVKMTVASDLHLDAIAYLDQGKKRTAGDILKIKNIPNSTNISAAVKIYLRERDRYSAAFQFSRLSNDMILSEAKSKLEFWEELVEIGREYYIKSERIVSQSWIMAYYALIRARYPDKVKPFFDAVFLDRETFVTADNFYTLLSNSKTSKKHSLTSAARDAYFYMTWHSYRDNKPIRLKYDPNQIYPRLFDEDEG